ncbi:hypothetical protein BFP70_12170 [Thioclava sp. SK-1]|uniref:flagellar hook capping FlgD N-terminal domain-containing protein n=1 Tax=Thioclava sp. SK-1 TaxID=1889770 RepID=UPI00082447BE|nr:flagellar hook capping FlgD N-terminal domain-containing protein [Thioclava sp. SK-1]OCX63402.1 hypothetical protein BFP70_12170 [Thioclava sp. SK-1]
MATVSAATSAATTTTTASSTATADATENSASAITSDFTTFLQMLTVQMQNQDPLNPMDSTDFAVQLATFSGVEQTVQTNQLLETLIGKVSGSGISELASWVGMDARTDQPVYFYGDPITVATDAASDADSAKLSVYNAGGTKIYSATVDVTEDLVQWDGTNNAGTTVAAGSYTFKLESYSGDDLLSTNTAEAYGRIVEARVADGGTELVMASGATVNSSAVTALRSPS